MTNIDPSYVDRLLNFDPLAQAETLTGKSYKEDRETSAMGFLMLNENRVSKENALKQTNDLYRGMEFLDAVDIVLDLGFELVYANVLTEAKSERKVHFQVYWRKGILLVLESYSTRVNKAIIYYNYQNADGDSHPRPEGINGSSYWTRRTPGFQDVLPDDPWVMVGDKQVSEGLRHYVNLLDLSGGVLETWKYTPSILSLYSYAENSDWDADDFSDGWFDRYDARVVARIEEFSEPVRSMLLAGRVGKDWD